MWHGAEEDEESERTGAAEEEGWRGWRGIGEGYDVMDVILAISGNFYDSISSRNSNNLISANRSRRRGHGIPAFRHNSGHHILRYMYQALEPVSCNWCGSFRFLKSRGKALVLIWMAGEVSWDSCHAQGKRLMKEIVEGKEYYV